MGGARACASAELATADDAARAAAASAAASAPASRRQRPSRSADSSPAAVGPLGSGAPPAVRRRRATCAQASSTLPKGVVVSKSLLRLIGTSHSALPVWMSAANCARRGAVGRVGVGRSA